MAGTRRAKRLNEDDPVAGEARWCLLIHQLPPRPLYLRARIRQRLERVGAIALKNAVYVLPRTASCLEDFQWLAQEAVAGGGEAFLCHSGFVFGLDDNELAERFRRARAADYAELVAASREVLSQLGRRRSGGRDDDVAGRFRRLKKRLQEVVAIDFFAAPERGQAEAAVQALESRLHHSEEAAAARRAHPHADLVGKTWVTRRGVHVDRIASAWLVRRFVDPAAHFRFVDAHEVAPAAGELCFDMVNGDFTHRGERCTFEDLVARLGLRDIGIQSLAEIVHDIDLKDGKFARAEAAGIEQLVTGLCRAHAADDERLERGLELFDDLYRSYATANEPRAARQRPRRKRGGKR